MGSDICAFGASSNGHSHYKAASGPYEPPPATPAGLGSMNYSPRHSHKPASLSNSRNINMKHLSLNISPVNVPTSPAKKNKPPALCIPPSEVTPTKPFSRSFLEGSNGLPRRESSVEQGVNSKPADGFANALPTGDAANGSFTFRDFNSGSFTSQVISPPRLPPWRSGATSRSSDMLQSPFGTTSLRQSPDQSVTGRFGSTDLIDDSEICKPAIFPEDHLSADGLCKRTRHLSEPNAHPQGQPLEYKVDKRSSVGGKAATGQMSPSKSVHSESHHQASYTFTIPEELQESSMVYAYPEGPANALNSTLYLFSDPHTSDHKVDINDYDLVVNVAKECTDLSSSFDDKNGSKQYLWVPWSHNSKISKDLPDIMRLIAAMDQPGKKILVHCQCGVSRSACVVVAYFMTKFGLSVNEAYELLKSGTRNSPHSFAQQVSDSGNVVEACDRICPNMSLIFELMDFGEKLHDSRSK